MTEFKSIKIKTEVFDKLVQQPGRTMSGKILQLIEKKVEQVEPVVEQVESLPSFAEIVDQDDFDIIYVNIKGKIQAQINDTVETEVRSLKKRY